MTVKKESNRDEKRIVLMDLDSTLMDSTNVRKLALAQALRAIIPLVLPGFLDSEREEPDFIHACVDFYEALVYYRWPLYRYSKLGDFRQQWNLEYSYAVFLVLMVLMARSKDNNVEFQKCLYNSGEGKKIIMNCCCSSFSGKERYFPI